MTLFDLILILIVFGFIWFGFWFGLVYALGGLAGLIVGAAVASRYYDEVAKWISFISKNENLTKIISFLIVYIVINRLVGFIFFILDRIIRPIINLPFLKTINRLGGAIFGLVTGVLTVGLILYFVSRIPLEWLTSLIEKSKTSSYFIELAKVLLPLLPEVLKKLKSVI
jgi:membrane protein required for colicin V production